MIFSVLVFLSMLQTMITEDNVIATAGYEGKRPQVIFLNYFESFPTEPYPVKTAGPSREVPPDRRYLLPSYMTYMIYLILGSLSLLILFHLLRRRPIAHFDGGEHFLYDRAEETELSNLRNSRQVDQSKLFYYQKRTNHISTSHKLCSTFPKDFQPEMSGLTDEEYAQVLFKGGWAVLRKVLY
ncbi:unnamed protein product [Caenorhabditis brenneri]